MQTIISTPLKIPLIEPTDWNKWWDLWYRQASPMQKTSNNHNRASAQWRGFDIWVKPGIDAETVTHYKSKNLNCPEMFTSIFDNLDKFPIDIEIIRVVSSLSAVLPHTDADSELLSVRSLIYDNNVRPNFYYLKDNKREYQLLPPSTNTWAYWDHKKKHGTDWYLGHSKILITYFGTLKTPEYLDILRSGIDNYSDYVIYT